MRVLFLDVKEQSPAFIEIEDSLDVFYEKIGCSTIDIVHRKIGGEYYDIICDDEGLFVEEPIVSACTPDGRPALVGSLIVAKHDGEGGLVGLGMRDVGKLTLALAKAHQGDQPRVVLVLDE